MLNFDLRGKNMHLHGINGAKRLAAGLTVLALAAMPSAPAAATVLKIATVSPDGTTWMQKLRAGATEIKRRTDGRVRFKFYPGGIMGNDQSVLRKIRVGQLQGGAVAGGSLAKIYPDVQIYGHPFLFRSFEEVDYTRNHMDDLIVKGLEQRGLVVFGLAEGGFAYMMSNKPLRSIEDVRAQKVWIPSGDIISQTSFKSAGISPIPLPISDVLTGLQTGLINTVAASPIATIALQWHTKVKYLTDTPISYFTATLAIDRKAFMRINPEDRALVRAVMTQVFKDIDRQNRLDNVKAREALHHQGITFVPVPAVVLAEWKRAAATARQQLIKMGVYTPRMLNTLKDHLDTYRHMQNNARVAR